MMHISDGIYSDYFTLKKTDLPFITKCMWYSCHWDDIHCLNDCCLRTSLMDYFNDFNICEKTTVTSEGLSKPTGSNELWKHVAAGAATGATSKTVTAPLDRLKVTLQVSQKNKTTLRESLQSLMKEGGFFSFWRGNGINVLKAMPEMAMKFSIYNEVKSHIKSHKGVEELEISDRFLAGSMAGAASQTIIFPLEVIKTRFVLRKTGESSWSCVQDMFSGRSYKCLFRGYVPNLIGIIMYSGVDLSIYETLKKEYLQRTSSDHQLNIFILLTCGIFSSACGQVISYPMNLIKTRFQAQARVYSEGNLSMLSTLKSILIKDGVPGLYRGLLANLLKVAPSVGISYVVYEHTREYLGASMS